MIIGSTFTPYLFFSWLKLIINYDLIITMIDIILSDQLIKCLEFDFPWCKLITCALGYDTVGNPKNPFVCIIQYIKFLCTMNINHGTIHEAIYCNVITILMNNSTIAIMFEEYEPFLLVHIFEFLIFYIYLIISSASSDTYCWWKLEMDLNLCCRTSGWSRKENYESIYPDSYCTCNNDLFDYNTHLQF